jgi:hypothetical protein
MSQKYLDEEDVRVIEEEGEKISVLDSGDVKEELITEN